MGPVPEHRTTGVLVELTVDLLKNILSSQPNRQIKCQLARFSKTREVKTLHHVETLRLLSLNLLMFWSGLGTEPLNQVWLPVKETDLAPQMSFKKARAVSAISLVCGTSIVDGSVVTLNSGFWAGPRVSLKSKTYRNQISHTQSETPSDFINLITETGLTEQTSPDSRQSCGEERSVGVFTNSH